MVTGSYPPDPCGVGDYTYNLVKRLRENFVDVEVLKTTRLSLKDLKKIRNEHYDLIHVQYPSKGYGYKLFPQIYSLMSNSVVTLHEFAEAHILRKISILPFSFCKSLIFTSENELENTKKFYPWIKNKSKVIPIGSNIAESNESIPFEGRNNTIIYFGLIRPEKGLEEFFKLRELLINANLLNYKFQILGRIDESKKEYGDKILTLAKEKGIDVRLNLSSQEVAKNLQMAKFGYLHFPDGATERRGSLLALIKNGVCTFTTKSKKTPSFFSKSMVFISETADVLNALNDKDIDFRKLQENCYKNSFNFSWKKVIQEHYEHYEIVEASI